MTKTEEEEKHKRIEQIFKVGRLTHLMTTIVTVGLVNIYFMMKQLDSIEKVLNKKISRAMHGLVSGMVVLTLLSFIAQLINKELNEYFWVMAVLSWAGLALHSISISNKITIYVGIQNNTQQSFNLASIWLYNIFYINHKINELISTQKVRVSNEHYYSLPCNEEVAKARMKGKIDAFKESLGVDKADISDEEADRLYNRVNSVKNRDSYRKELPWVDISAIKNLLMNIKLR